MYIHLYTLPETNSSQLKMGWDPKGKDRIASIFPFSGAMDVSFTECIDGQFLSNEKRDQTVVWDRG